MLLTLLCLLEKLFYMNLLLVHVKLLLMMMIIIIFGHSDNYVMETQAIDYYSSDFCDWSFPVCSFLFSIACFCSEDCSGMKLVVSSLSL